MHVTGPLSAAGNSAAAQATADQLDGRRDENPREPPNKRTRANKGNGPQHPAGNKVAESYCYAWNDGKCDEPCPAGRKHGCRWCGGGHRGYECPKSGGKGSSKGSKGDYGNNRKNGGKKKKRNKTGKKGKGGGKASTN